MNENVLLSKIVPNTTPSSWSQAYSTLNLYIVISVIKRNITSSADDDAQSKVVTTYGKEMLEKLQREYFAQDEKSLKNIKTAVENAFKDDDPSYECSTILITIQNYIAYIILVNSGTVLLKRGEKIGITAQAEKNRIVSFSGKLEPSDFVILAIDSFIKKVTVSKLSQALSTHSPIEAAEHLAPLVHEGSDGTEAAIILFITPPKENVADENLESEEMDDPKPTQSLLKSIYSKIIPSPQLIKRLLHDKRNILFIVMILVVAFFLLFLYVDKKGQETKKANDKLQTILLPAQKKYEEADALESLNKNLSVQNLLDAKAQVSKEINSFEKGSSQRETLENFLETIENRLKDFQDTQALTNKKIIVDTKTNSNIKIIGGITAKSGKLYIADKNNGYVLDVERDASFETDAKNIKNITADEAQIYIQTIDGVYKIDKSSKKSEKLFAQTSDLSISGIDTFLGNIYVINSGKNDIEKYSSSNYEKTSYFKEGFGLSGAPSAFSIDGSVFVLLENGTIVKFTKGEKDEFVLKGLVTPFDNNAILYTEKDFSNLYVLNKKSKTLAVISKNGDYQKQYNLSELGNILYLAADEGKKKIYVATENQLISFDL